MRRNYRRKVDEKTNWREIATHFGCIKQSERGMEQSEIGGARTEWGFREGWFIFCAPCIGVFKPWIGNLQGTSGERFAGNRGRKRSRSVVWSHSCHHGSTAHGGGATTETKGEAHERIIPGCCNVGEVGAALQAILCPVHVRWDRCEFEQPRVTTLCLVPLQMARVGFACCSTVLTRRQVSASIGL